ncbi:MAG: oligosaccharide flippase family protein [Acidobacteriota bacterium]
MPADREAPPDTETAPSPEPPGAAAVTAGLFLRSSGAAALSQILRVASALGAQLLLRRYVPPEDWGLFQWAMVLFLVLGAVRDLGLAHHVLRVDPRPWGNLLAVEVLWGGLLMAATLVLAPVLALLHRADPGALHPQTLGILRCLALFLFFEGLATVPKVYLEGELRVGRAVAPELWRSLAFVAVACAMAVLGYGVWSLAVGHTASAAVYAGALWWRVRGEIPWSWHSGGTLRLLVGALPLAGIWFLGILIRQVDPLILGRRAPFADVGHYTFAFEWATLASGLILLPAITRVLYPALVRFGRRSREMFRAYALSTLFVLAFEVPAALFLMLNAELVVRLVGGGAWVDAPTYLRILCFVPLVDPFSRLGGEVMKALHRDRLWLAASLSTVVTLVVAGFWAVDRFGPIGMAWVRLLSPGGALLAWGLYRVSPEGFRRFLGDLTFTYLVPVPLFAAAWWLSGGGPVAGHGDPLRFALCAAAGVLSILVAARRFGGDFMAFFRPS